MFKVLITYVEVDGDNYMHVEEFEHVPRVGEYIKVGRNGATHEVVQVTHVLGEEKPDHPYLYAASVEKRSQPHPAILRLEEEAGG